MKHVEVNSELHEKYNNYYQEPISKWRELGAKAKANNIISMAGTAKYTKVLEVGAGDGAILKILNDKNFCTELFALEISESGIEKIKSRNLNSLKRVLLFDGYSTSFSDKEFDLVYCSHVIEHVEHPRILLREIKRISKNQIFEVPIDFSFSVDKKINHFLSYGHINIYTPALFRFLLKSEGFEISRDSPKMLDREVNKYILAEKRKQSGILKYLAFYTKNMLVRAIWKILPLKLKD
ncbi:MAG: class I SAM-dependent methyltransferase, partial [Bacteroidales bacterium]|nr:class I SAM-dependent methyltransferase [Bacteroidales bacterium]